MLEGGYRILQSPYPDIQELRGGTIGLFYRYPLPNIFLEKWDFTGYGTVKMLQIPRIRKCFAFPSLALQIAFSDQIANFKFIYLLHQLESVLPLSLTKKSPFRTVTFQTEISLFCIVSLTVS